MVKNNGWIRHKDLNDFPDPKELQSIHFQYKGFDIYTQPEPCGGWVIKEILQNLDSAKWNSPEEELIQIAQSINLGHRKRAEIAKSKALIFQDKGTGETTHFSILDSEGTALSITASINAYYGSGAANPDFGFLYNSYMDDFIYNEPDNKYAVGPNKMAYSSMSPTIVTKDGEIALIIGSPGSARIISTVAQLIHKYTTSNREQEELLNIPRIHAINNKLFFESEIEKKSSENWLGDWEIGEHKNDLGENELNPYFGGVHCILLDHNHFYALADPRRDGLAIQK
jgi:gamma-glutamyltranspeptidase/glutathione hydrolase